MDGCFGLLEQHMGWFKVSWHAAELGLFWTLLVLWARKKRNGRGHVSFVFLYSATMEADQALCSLPQGGSDHHI